MRVRFWLATVCVAAHVMSADAAETHDNAKKSARAILRIFLSSPKGVGGDFLPESFLLPEPCSENTSPTYKPRTSRLPSHNACSSDSSCRRYTDPRRCRWLKTN